MPMDQATDSSQPAASCCGELIRRLALVGSTGWILMYFSEHLFWARYRPGEDSLGGYVQTWFFYSLAGYAMLAVLSLFRARRFSAVFLAGALFGWIIEGVVVETMYADPPLSISFTGLAWHACISVMVGWRLLPDLLARGTIRAWTVSAVIGLLYGVWAINWWREAPDTAPAGVTEFAVFSFACTLILIVGYSVQAWSRRGSIVIHAGEGILLLTLGVGFFLFKSIFLPVSLCILPPLLVLVFATLGWNRRNAGVGSELEIPLRRIPVRNALGLLLIPSTAIVVYALAGAAGAMLPTNWALYCVTTPLGFVLLIVALLRIWFAPKPPCAASNAIALGEGRGDPASSSAAHGGGAG